MKLGSGIRTRLGILAVAGASAIGLAAQDIPASQPDVPVPQLKPGSERRISPESKMPAIIPLQTVELVVPKGTPIQVALEDEVRVKQPGQRIRARVVEPVYAFDKLV